MKNVKNIQIILKPWYGSYNFGIIAEYIAIFFLVLKGYKILRRRYKTFVGEIDIIAKKANCLAAVEVKARKNASVLIEELLQSKQKERIKRAMIAFLSVNSGNSKLQNCSVRFDLLIINMKKIPHHLQGFWE